MPKNYVANIMRTIIGPDFDNWVNQRIEERNQKMLTEHNMMISVDPQIYQAYMNSTNVSRK